MTHTVARAAARAPRIAATATSGSSAKASINRLIVGSEATLPNTSGWARIIAASARQSPPNAMVTAKSSTVLPGSWIDRASRHGLNPCDRPAANPLTCAVCSSSAAPADEISDSPPTSTRTPEPDRIPFTYGVPFPLPKPDLRQAQVSQAGQALPCITGPESPTSHERSRLGAGQQGHLDGICTPTYQIEPGAEILQRKLMAANAIQR